MYILMTLLSSGRLSRLSAHSRPLARAGGSGAMITKEVGESVSAAIKAHL